MRSSLKSQLANYFLRNGYFRFPDENLRKLKGQNYKKGYEVRLVTNDEKELLKLSSLLDKAGFKVSKPFRKNNKYVQPIYGKDAVEKFQNLIKDINIV